jgi:hypothetical protein
VIIVDTSVWIEFFRQREPWHASLRRLLESRQVLALECIFGELLQGVKNEREAAVILEYWTHLPKLDENGLWLEAGDQARRHGWPTKGVGLIDAFIMTGARRCDGRVWTLDKKLESILEPKKRYRE